MHDNEERPEPRVRIKLTGAVVGERGETWFPGETHEAGESLARDLVRRGKAAYVDPPAGRRGRR